ncbi:MAG: phosphatidylglycerophosphatase A, partial [Deltaproteobacteria bacterium]|nr:phosphatidylglycerophosphatase A [Deltaproteobacteria bacterium]
MKTFKERTYLFLASGTYLGYSPFAPGTVGTLWGIPVAIAITLIIPSSLGLHATMALQGGIIAILTVIAIIIASGAAKVLNAKDPGLIVCDEVVGFCMAAFMVELTVINIILVFILFRIFDILKPSPVSLI